MVAFRRKLFYQQQINKRSAVGQDDYYHLTSKQHHRFPPGRHCSAFSTTRYTAYYDQKDQGNL